MDKTHAYWPVLPAEAALPLNIPPAPATSCELFQNASPPGPWPACTTRCARISPIRLLNSCSTSQRRLFPDTDNFFCKIAVARNTDFLVGSFVTGKQTRQQYREQVSGQHRRCCRSLQEITRRWPLRSGRSQGKGAGEDARSCLQQDCSRLRAQLSPATSG